MAGQEPWRHVMMSQLSVLWSKTAYLEVTAIDFGREGGPDLQVASHFDVRGLSRGPDLTSSSCHEEILEDTHTW